MITVLSGGTGTPKLLQGLVKVVKSQDITVIVNTLENGYFSGVYVAPDLDTVMYTLAGKINEDTWYGMAGDTFITHDQLKEMGCPELLRIGDRDRAIKIQKTLLLNKYPLSQAVDIQRKKLSIRSRIIPMSNHTSDITICTDEGDLEFHEFLIERQAQPQVTDIVYNQVSPAPGVIDTIKSSDMVLIGPSNPITSIGPIISTKGVRKYLKDAFVVAVSPIIGDRPVSGPAAKFMHAMGYDVSSMGVAGIYQEFLDKFIMDTADASYQQEIEKLISDVMITHTIMNNVKDKVSLARKIMGVNV